ncbi:Multidrug resistance-associated protein [Blattamonas nauphoetae]|uniref:Multidrug resistance-associated protein n=1 Tax=Blattamonas nauphoetae TaxID=2049346 RepID=A0ABQ9YJ80_9EUKA|nr:Multidrug resistance-associated protein [Blattamonas nauphoetae]
MECWECGGKYLLIHYAVQVRGGLSGLIFRKTMRLDLNASQEVNNGQLLSLIAADTRNIAELLPDSFQLLLVPIQMIVPLVILSVNWGVIGLMSLATVAVIVPIQILLLKGLSRALASYFKHNDIRNEVTKETIEGIRTIKCQTSEGEFIARIEERRKAQLKSVFLLTFITQLTYSVLSALPFLARFTTMVVAINAGGISQKDFGTEVMPMLAYVSQVAQPGHGLPELLKSMSMIFVAQRRIRDFLLSAEETKEEREEDGEDEIAVEIENGRFEWGGREKNSERTRQEKTEKEGEEEEMEEERGILENVNIRVKRGTLTIITGKVGGGKSTLAAGMAGVLKATKGRVRINGRVGFCPQQAWLANTTISKNITFGKEFEKEKFWETISVCGLWKDVKDLGGHEETEIGEGGKNVSGGQRRRLQLARAVYACKDIYVLDEVLGGSDVKVEKEVMEKCICGKLGEKTVILVTKNKKWKRLADKVIRVGDGGVVEEEGKGDRKVNATPSHSSSSPSTIAPSPQQVGEIAEGREISSEELGEDGNEVNGDDGRDETMNEPECCRNHTCESEYSKGNENEENEIDWEEEERMKAGARMTEEEEMNTHGVGVGTYWKYVKSLLPWPLVIVLVVAIVGGIGLESFGLYWLGVIGTESEMGGVSYEMKVGLSGVIGAGLLVVLAVRAVLMGCGGARSGRILHRKMVESVVGAPCVFFDQNPSGRILNRFTGDLAQMDTRLVSVVVGVVGLWLSMVGSIVINTIDHIWFLVIGPPILVVFVVVLVLYARGSRNLQRLESIKRSSVLSKFGESGSLNGQWTIRGFGMSEEWEEELWKVNDEWSIRFLLVCEGQLWSSLYTSVISSLFMCGVVIFGWNFMSPVKLAVGIESALEFGYHGQQLVGLTVDMDTRMTSVERVLFYGEKLPRERNTKRSSSRSSGAHSTASNPTASSHSAESSHSAGSLEGEGSGQEEVGTGRARSGQIRFEDVTLRYRKGLPAALSNVSFSIEGGESVGICGRTGAGKSSLVQGLLRLVELDLDEDEKEEKGKKEKKGGRREEGDSKAERRGQNGRILVDGVDISSIGLRELRRSIGVIPQDGKLFSGTMRWNTDMSGGHSDEEVWRVLEMVELGGVVRSMEGGLDHVVGDGGRELSTGQRQLLWMARMILDEKEIIILDEATGSVDTETERRMSQMLQEELVGKTRIVISHGMEGIVGLDKVIVMEDGRVAEFGETESLLNDPNSRLNTFVRETEMEMEENAVDE